MYITRRKGVGGMCPLCFLPQSLHLCSEVFICGAVYLVTSEVSLVFVAGKNQFSLSFPPPVYPGACILCVCVCVRACMRVYVCAYVSTQPLFSLLQLTHLRSPSSQLTS